MEAFSTNLPANLFPEFCAPARKTHRSARRHLRVSMLQNDGNTTNEKCLRTRIPGKTIAEPPQSKNPVYLNYFSEVFPPIQRSAEVYPRGEPERAEESWSAQGRTGAHEGGGRKRGGGVQIRRRDGTDRNAHGMTGEEKK